MMRADHQDALEQVMACLDGELTPVEAASVRAHVAGCRECQEAEADLREVAGRLALWTVEAPPASLKAPVGAGRMTRVRGWLPIAATLLVAAGAGTIWFADRRTPPGAAVTSGSESIEASAEALAYPEQLSEGGEATRVAGNRAATLGYVQAEQDGAGAPLLARTARLTLLVSDLDAARTAGDRILAAAGGFIGQVRLSDDRGAARLLRQTMRVPEKTLDTTMDQLKRIGKVRREGRDAEDVTQQSTDLDARLSNARNSEKRLNDILANRSGTLTDVLEVEREITRARGEIERMEAVRRTLDRRITYATIELEMAEEQKSELGIAEQSLSRQLRNALVEGWNTAFNSVLSAGLAIARVAPTLVLWGLVLVVPYRMLRRRYVG